MIGNIIIFVILIIQKMKICRRFKDKFICIIDSFWIHKAILFYILNLLSLSSFVLIKTMQSNILIIYFWCLITLNSSFFFIFLLNLLIVRWSKHFICIYIIMIGLYFIFINQSNFINSVICIFRIK